MREVEKDGVLIDICPECKGVWLDRGELDKLLQEVREIRPAFNDWYEHHEQDYSNKDKYQERNHERNYDKSHSQNNYDDSYSRHGNDKSYYKRKKKKSVLDVFGDLFD
jgi:Zn-finger nucleic acid-binding protein